VGVNFLCDHPSFRMGAILSSCPGRRKAVGWEEALGVPTEYDWEGLPDEQIDAYYNAKDAANEELEKLTGKAVNEDAEWVGKIPEQTKEMLKALLLRRAVGLVHILKPIEEQRRSMRIMQSKGALPENHYASFEHADELCGNELKSIMEESQIIAPGTPPNAIIQSAVQLYHQGMGRPDGSDDDGESDDGEDEPSGLDNLKGGFFKNAKKEEDKTAHGFEIGADVIAHSLQTASLNGQVGTVLGARGERVAVAFPPPAGEKALKPANLKLVPPAPKIHPDATDAPSTQFQVVLHRAEKEGLGLALNHEPPLSAQQPGQESCLVIADVLENGFAKKYNDAQEASAQEARNLGRSRGNPHDDPDLTLRQGDRILAIVDGSLPEERQRPVGGNSTAILEVITTGHTPIIFIIGRLLGPPLRFKVGQQVKANCGQRGWQDGAVVSVWEEQNGNMVPYVIRLKENGNAVFAPNDGDDCVLKGEPRFKVGDFAMENHEGSYKKGKITEVRDDGVCASYSIMVDGDNVLEAPEDLNMFIRPICRFKKGTKVFANVKQEFVPGTIDACYHPNWVYACRLDTGDTVFVPEDIDVFCKKR